MVNIEDTDISVVEKPILCAEQATEAFISMKDDAHETLLVA